MGRGRWKAGGPADCNGRPDDYGEESMIRVLTIEREYGSGGGEIASRVAKSLGWTLYDQLLTNEIARLMECDCQVVSEREEKRDPLFYRLMRSFMRGSHEGSLNAPG